MQWTRRARAATSNPAPRPELSARQFELRSVPAAAVRAHDERGGSRRRRHGCAPLRWRDRASCRRVIREYRCQTAFDACSSRHSRQSHPTPSRSQSRFGRGSRPCPRRTRPATPPRFVRACSPLLQARGWNVRSDHAGVAHPRGSPAAVDSSLVLRLLNAGLRLPGASTTVSGHLRCPPTPASSAAHPAVPARSSPARTIRRANVPCRRHRHPTR